jgi:hypothetical protein
MVPDCKSLILWELRGINAGFRGSTEMDERRRRTNLGPVRALQGNFGRARSCPRMALEELRASGILES